MGALVATIGGVSEQRPIDGPSGSAEWKRPVEALWDAVAQLREREDARRRRRDKPPVTNKEIAEQIHVSDRTLGDWLRKRTVVPDWYELRKLVEYLGGNPDAWQPQWERAKAAYDGRPRRTARSNRTPPDGGGDPSNRSGDPGPTGAGVSPLRPAAAADPTANATVRAEAGRPLGITPSVAVPTAPRRRRMVVLVALVALLLAVAGTVAAWSVRSRAPAVAVPSSSQPTPSARVWHATIVNTWSAARSKDVGVYRYKSPLRAEWELPGHLGGDSISVVCQYRHGRTLTDPGSGQSSPVWDKTDDGFWIPDLYTDLPKVSGEVPPAGIPICTGVT